MCVDIHLIFKNTKTSKTLYVRTARYHKKKESLEIKKKKRIKKKKERSQEKEKSKFERTLSFSSTVSCEVVPGSTEHTGQRREQERDETANSSCDQILPVQRNEG